jgi:hypothetical protein
MKPMKIRSLALAITALSSITASQAVLINLNYNNAGDTPSGLSGPAGGLGTTWNSVTSSGATGALQDSANDPTTVSVATTGYNAGPDLSTATPGNLPIYRSFLSSFGRPGSHTVTINGLASEGLYDIWLLSYRDIATGGTERSVGTWATTNTTSPSSQLVDSEADLDAVAFIDGYNYVLFSNVEATVGGVISFTGDGVGSAINSERRRLHLNGLQINAVPEPSSTALLGLGGLALMLRRRR